MSKSEEIPSSTKHNQRFFILVAAIILVAAVFYIGYNAGKKLVMVDAETPEQPDTVNSATDAEQKSTDMVEGIDDVSNTLNDIEDIVK